MKDEFADQLYADLMADNWRRMLAVYRAHLADLCPRYPRDEVETKCGWLGTLFIIRGQCAERVALPQADGRHLTPGQAEAELRREILAHLRNDVTGYAGWCAARDNPEMAEAKLARVFRNLRLTHLLAAPAAPAEAADGKAVYDEAALRG